MSTLTEIKNIWRTIANLRRKVECVCSRPNLPTPPTTGSTYYLQYDVATNTYTWEPN